MKTALLVAAIVLIAVPARAQTNDSRWEPWLGCWELALDNQRDSGSTDGSLARASRPAAVRDGSPRVCVTRVSDGARFETTVGGQAAIDQTLVADGVSHALNDAECTGTQRTEWSRNGLRLYASAELRCQGDEGPRKVSGFSLIATNGDWIDIQAVAVGSRETVRAKRYVRAGNTPRLDRPTVVASGLTLDEVKEAAAKVAPAAIEEALIQTNAGYNLTAKRMIELDDAGVPDRVIDLIVALSYPERFIVERGVAQTAQTVIVRDPFFAGWAFGYYDAFYGSPYYYEPFAYRGRVLGDYVGYGGNVPALQPSGTGRVVNGQGYTRIQTRDTGSTDSTPTVTRASSSRSAEPVGGSASSSPAPSSSSSSSSSSGSSSGSSGGSASSSGSSGSSSSGDTGRTAVPR